MTGELKNSFLYLFVLGFLLICFVMGLFVVFQGVGWFFSSLK